ncbi:hypothetical protein ACOI9X_23485 [Pseudomonas sp. P2757]|uniref:hypothetical protein n=1 Tax=unclassified Pseudomonas TaxID=196821 RepID=UPI003B5C9D70
MIDILLTRFEPRLDNISLRRLITVRSDPVEGLEALTPYVAADRFAESLKRIFIPNAFTLDFIQEMLERAHIFSVENFSTEQQYLSRLYNPPEPEVFPICLTGLAGVGKSATITALRKVLPGPKDLQIDHYATAAKVMSYWYASAKGKGLARHMLGDFLKTKPSPSQNVATLLTHCRSRAYGQGISLLLLEEMQYINTGQGAARVTDILVTMAAIGLPLVYVANYSLLNKLKARNNEDTQRLLSAPRIMLPDAPDSDAWHEYVKECVAASDDRFGIKSSALADELYRSTFGIKRLGVQLLKLSYLEARSAGRWTIELQDLQAAYRSSAYSIFKNDVEDLQREVLQRSSVGVRADLRCPFDIPLRTTVGDFFRKDREHRVATTVFLSSLNATELSRLNEIAPKVANPSLSEKVRKPPIRQTSEDEMARLHSKILNDILAEKPKRPHP